MEREGWTAKHDDEHEDCSLALAAACYAIPDDERQFESCRADGIPDLWPWDAKWWKPTPRNRIRELTKAGALIAAEIDRLLRAQKKAREK